MVDTRQAGTDELFGDLADLMEELAEKTRLCFSAAARPIMRSRQLKAGPFRRSPLDIRTPVLVNHPSSFLFRLDQLAALLTASDRIPVGRLRRILLLPEFYQAGNQVLAAATPLEDTLVFYLSPLRLLLAGPDVRPLWRKGGDYLFEALFQFHENRDAAMPGSLFFLPEGSVAGDEFLAMQAIHDRFLMRHPLHLQADPNRSGQHD